LRRSEKCRETSENWAETAAACGSRAVKGKKQANEMAIGANTVRHISVKPLSQLILWQGFGIICENDKVGVDKDITRPVGRRRLHPCHLPESLDMGNKYEEKAGFLEYMNGNDLKSFAGGNHAAKSISE